VGIDVVAVDRVARLISDDPTACDRFLTPREQAACRGARRPERVAARFAAKEAVLKALGTGLGPRMRWTEVEVVRGSAGAPRVELHGEVAEAARRRGLTSFEVSLTHSAGLAVASAIAIAG
jgi:holo-[acyl-carrier protein] synthase